MTTPDQPRDGAGELLAKRRRCFVISPIGQEGSPVRAHADDVMEYIINPALAKHGIDGKRSDQMAESGAITEQMFREIVSADVCVVVLTYSNPNVYYELAVAQSAARPVVLLLEKGQVLPFDVKDLRCIQYEMTPVSRLVKGTYAERVDEMLEEIKKTGWRAPGLFEQFGVGHRLEDELQVRRLLKRARPEVLRFGRDKRYALPADPQREISLLVGDLTEMQNQPFGTDCVVIPENTDLQLGRYYDADSVSGTLRFLDAERSADGRIVRDALSQALLQSVKDQGIALPTEPGRVIATRATHLDREYGIKCVFHTAALQGSVGDGYAMMNEVLDDCVRNVFDRFAEIAPGAGLSSILFPMFGAATTTMEPLEVARRLLNPILHKMTTIEQCRKTVILARFESHRQAVYQAAAELDLKEIA